MLIELAANELWRNDKEVLIDTFKPFESCMEIAGRKWEEKYE